MATAGARDGDDLCDFRRVGGACCVEHGRRRCSKDGAWMPVPQAADPVAAKGGMATSLSRAADAICRCTPAARLDPQRVERRLADARFEMCQCDHRDEEHAPVLAK
jgi:hypothetical protein